MIFTGVEFWHANHHTFEFYDGEFETPELLGKIDPEVHQGQDFKIVLIQSYSSLAGILVNPGLVDLVVRVHHDKKVSYTVEIKCIVINYNIDYQTGYLSVKLRCVKVECDD